MMVSGGVLEEEGYNKDQVYNLRSMNKRTTSSELKTPPDNVIQRSFPATGREIFSYRKGRGEFNTTHTHLLLKLEP